jgi:hypothetical protein
MNRELLSPLPHCLILRRLEHVSNRVSSRLHMLASYSHYLSPPLVATTFYFHLLSLMRTQLRMSITITSNATASTCDNEDDGLRAVTSGKAIFIIFHLFRLCHYLRSGCPLFCLSQASLLLYHMWHLAQFLCNQKGYWSRAETN